MMVNLGQQERQEELVQLVKLEKQVYRVIQVNRVSLVKREKLALREKLENKA